MTSSSESFHWSILFSFFPLLSLQCHRQLCSLTLDVIIFVLVSYCWHFNSGAPQSGLTQTARNHTSQPFLTAAPVASNFSQIKGLFYLDFFFFFPLWPGPLLNKPNCLSLIWWLLVTFSVFPVSLSGGHKAVLCPEIASEDKNNTGGNTTRTSPVLFCFLYI